MNKTLALNGILTLFLTIKSKMNILKDERAIKLYIEILRYVEETYPIIGNTDNDRNNK